MLEEPLRLQRSLTESRAPVKRSNLGTRRGDRISWDLLDLLRAASLPLDALCQCGEIRAQLAILSRKWLNLALHRWY
jgi:hypothetical protein